MTTIVDSSTEPVNQLYKMELANNRPIDNSLASINDVLQISCNWKISNNKQFRDAFTTVLSNQELEKTNFEDIVSLDTCISLQPVQSNNEPCMIDIKLTNHQRISRISIVSEANVLEFFKQSGEYDRTIFAELFDEFEDNSVYFAETKIVPSSTEASFKFTKTKSKNSVLWIYGIRLYLTEPINETNNFPMDIFNPEIVKSFLTKLSFNKENIIANNTELSNKNILNTTKSKSVEETNENDTTQSTTENPVLNVTEIMTYIDNKFHNMETRLMNRIDEMEQRTNKKLDLILQQLETQFSVK